MRLEGKAAVITGSASGFGEGMAHRFAEEGCAVVIADLQEDAGQAVADAIRNKGGRAEFLRCDVASPQDSQAMVSTCIKAFGKMDILINNAGWTHRNKPLMEVSEEEFDKVYAINVKAIYLATLAAVPHLRDIGGGVIINTSSTAGKRPRPGLTWYNSTKGAVDTMTLSMAAELAPDKIRVNAVCPVIGETGLVQAFMSGDDRPEIREKFRQTIPLGRFSTPLDVANAALFLASEEAAFLTGQLLYVDGGRVI